MSAVIWIVFETTQFPTLMGGGSARPWTFGRSSAWQRWVGPTNELHSIDEPPAADIAVFPTPDACCASLFIGRYSRCCRCIRCLPDGIRCTGGHQKYTRSDTVSCLCSPIRIYSFSICMYRYRTLSSLTFHIVATDQGFRGGLRRPGVVVKEKNLGRDHE